eukprot:TRINITY_DN568_c0_g1_i1.p1 TRINITY_DN568_c0_g1~~TRINITY_DN568_c0_g1_i1.p1  ORF type:complete len:397 (+),score=121.38 TRINITY_DN568_c0_g1_i1:538-1728(+)
MLNYRAREFTRFLHRLAAHPVFCQEEQFITFLQGNIEDSQSAQRTKAAEAPAKGAAPSPENSQPNLTEAHNRMVGPSTTSRFANLLKAPVCDSNPAFVERKKLYDQLQGNLELVAQSSGTMQRKWKELQLNYVQFSSRINSFSEQYAKQDAPNAEACERIASTCDHVSAILGEMVTQQKIHFEENLQDYRREVVAYKDQLERRNQVMHKYHMVLQALAGRRDRLNRLTPGTKQREAAQRDYDEMRQLCDKARGEFDDFTESCRLELDRAEAVRRTDAKRLIYGFAKLNMEFHMQMSDSWKSVLARMNEIAPLDQSLLQAEEIPTAEPKAQQQTEQPTFARELATAPSDDKEMPSPASTTSASSPEPSAVLASAVAVEDAAEEDDGQYAVPTFGGNE